MFARPRFGSASCTAHRRSHLPRRGQVQVAVPQACIPGIRLTVLAEHIGVVHEDVRHRLALQAPQHVAVALPVQNRDLNPATRGRVGRGRGPVNGIAGPVELERGPCPGFARWARHAGAPSLPPTHSLSKTVGAELANRAVPEPAARRRAAERAHCLSMTTARLPRHGLLHRCQALGCLRPINVFQLLDAWHCASTRTGPVRRSWSSAASRVRALLDTEHCGGVEREGEGGGVCPLPRGQKKSQAVPASLLLAHTNAKFRRIQAHSHWSRAIHALYIS